MTTTIYITVELKQSLKKALKKRYPDAVVVHETGFLRAQIKPLIALMAPGDNLVVVSATDLGRTPGDAMTTLQLALDRQVNVFVGNDRISIASEYLNFFHGLDADFASLRGHRSSLARTQKD